LESVGAIKILREKIVTVSIAANENEPAGTGEASGSDRESGRGTEKPKRSRLAKPSPREGHEVRNARTPFCDWDKLERVFHFSGSFTE